MEHVLKNGEILENYPWRNRCLVGGIMENKIPLHIVCDYYDFLKHKGEDMVVVTAYVPDRVKWIKDKKRKERD